MDKGRPRTRYYTSSAAWTGPLGQLHAPKQLLKARIAPHALEPRRDLEEHQRKVVLLIGALQPSERLRLVTETHIDQGNCRRWDILTVGERLQLRERLPCLGRLSVET